jgi:hypothetical protein
LAVRRDKRWWWWGVWIDGGGQRGWREGGEGGERGGGRGVVWVPKERWKAPCDSTHQSIGDHTSTIKCVCVSVCVCICVYVCMCVCVCVCVYTTSILPRPNRVCFYVCRVSVYVCMCQSIEDHMSTITTFWRQTCDKMHALDLTVE